jgi:hypothetical protein
MTTKLRVQWATWVNQAAPTTNYFRKTGYVMVSNQSSHVKFSYLWFTNPFPRSGANILSATLTLRTRAISGAGTVNLGVDLATAYPVGISMMNWNTRASKSGNQVSLTKSAPLADNTVWTFDVTNMVQTVGAGYGFSGFIISTTNTRDILIQGNMSATLDPVLEVEWTEAPLPPDSLSPSTGQAVGSALPILRWSFWDHAGATSMQSAQVQVAATEDGFGSPLWDSGTVASTACQLDLAATTCPAPAVDTLRWWRVRNQDSAGLWSAWSDPVSWQWHPRPTVTLLQPNGGVFSDPTPVIQWGYDGDMPQARWRASVSILDGSTWRVVAASGTVVSTETSWQPDVGLARAGTARIIVDVWDGRDREATPGLALYSSASGNFEFQPSDTVAPVAGLAIETHGLMPTVDLTWSRSEVPDRIDVYRDGSVLSRHEGLDWLISGDDYTMSDLTCPNGQHTWDVYAVVNGVSSVAASVTATIRHAPTWLIDPATQERVCIVGDGDHDMTMPETVEEFAPIGATSKVRITSAQYGYEGSISGQLAPWFGLPDTETPRLWRERLMAWKADPGRQLTLLIEDLQFHVGVTEITVASIKGHAGELFNVSFKFHQADRFIFGEGAAL